MKLKRLLLLGRKAMTNLDSILKSRDITLPTSLSSQSFGFSSSHVWMWELDYKESWGQKNWCFCTTVLEKTLESPLDCKEIQLVHPKGNQSWIFIGRTDVEAETPILWPPDAKSWIIWKDPDAVKDWRWEEKGTTEDEMVGWHHRLDGNEFEQTLGDSEEQESLVCCSPWRHRVSDTPHTHLKLYAWKLPSHLWALIPTVLFSLFLWSFLTVSASFSRCPALRLCTVFLLSRRKSIHTWCSIFHLYRNASWI